MSIARQPPAHRLVARRAIVRGLAWGLLCALLRRLVFWGTVLGRSGFMWCFSSAFEGSSVSPWVPPALAVVIALAVWAVLIGCAWQGCVTRGQSEAEAATNLTVLERALFWNTFKVVLVL